MSAHEKHDVVHFEDCPTELFDIVLHDMGDMNTRARTLDFAWRHVRPNGWLILDDMHVLGYEYAVRIFLEGRPAEIYGIKELTLDRFGRFSWLIRRLP